MIPFLGRDFTASMNKLITILSIIGSIASALGLYLQHYGPEQAKLAWSLAYWITFALTIYVLFVPGNKLETNVESKVSDSVKRYADPTAPGNAICVQHGELTISSSGPLSVKFDVPFTSPPEVEIVNEEGIEGHYVPAVSEVTRFQFVVTRRGCRFYSGSNDRYPDKFKWIATGSVMQEIKHAPKDAITTGA